MSGTTEPSTTEPKTGATPSPRRAVDTEDLFEAATYGAWLTVGIVATILFLRDLIQLFVLASYVDPPGSVVLHLLPTSMGAVLAFGMASHTRHRNDFVPKVPEPPEGFEEGRSAFDSGNYARAQEVWDGSIARAPPAERVFLRGLSAAAAVCRARMEADHQAVEASLDVVHRSLPAYEPVHLGIDVTGFIRDLEALRRDHDEDPHLPVLRSADDRA